MNPLDRFPLLIRECGGMMPKAWGRLGYGREVISCYGQVQDLSSLFPLQVSVALANKSADEVYLAIAGLESS